MKSSRLLAVVVVFAFLAACGVPSIGSSPTEPPAYLPPAAPTQVTATPGNTQVTLSWVAVPGATSYNIYWSTTANLTTINGTEVFGVTSPYVLAGLTNGTTYYYVITAASGHGESKPSSRVSAIPAVNPAPAAPTGVTAAAGDAHVTISWGAVSGATSYNIYWSTTTGVTAANGTQIAGATSPYLLTGLTNGTRYYFVVTSVNGNGESTPSSQVSSMPSSGPYISALIYTLAGGGVPPWGWLENVAVCSDRTCTTPIDNATVTVNGTVLTWSTYEQRYLGTVAVNAGGEAIIHVMVGSTLYAATATQFTASPTITRPTAGATWHSATSNTISWIGGAPTAGASYLWGMGPGPRPSATTGSSPPTVRKSCRAALCPPLFRRAASPQGVIG